MFADSVIHLAYKEHRQLLMTAQTKMVSQTPSRESQDQTIPRWTIDLSTKPRDRYKALAEAYEPQVRRLAALFDQLLADLGIPYALHGIINSAARLALRKLHSSTQTEEIKGIAETVGLPLYLLVAFNVLLDLLMGCTSGGVRSRDSSDSEGPRMLHFRTLDWGMDPLRSVIVQLDYVDGKSSLPNKYLGSSITYVGFVGVLTGVREGLSISLNFRALHNAHSLGERINFRLHHLLVLLGHRESISSMLRDCLLSDGRSSRAPATLAWVKEHLPSQHSTAAYLIFSDGDAAVTIEKDYNSGVVRESSSFIALTNHDLEDEAASTGNKPRVDREPTRQAVRLAALEGFLEESTDRRECIVKKWRHKVRSEYRRKLKDRPSQKAMPAREHQMQTRSATSAPEVQSNGSINTPDWQAVEDSVSVGTEELVSWVSSWPTTNECTHYAAIMDAHDGRVVWAKRYPEPIQEPIDQVRRTEMGFAV